MNVDRKKLFQYLAVPSMALVFYIGIIWVYRALGLPNPENIIAWAEKYYETYGYWVVLVGALAEGALFINWYLPGSIVVALGTVFARTTDLNIFLVLLLGILGFYLTALFNYALGRFGWYHVFMKLGLKAPLEKVQSKIREKGFKILFTTYIHPNFGALAATSAGILRLDFYKFAFYSLVAISLWNSFWTIIFYWIGAPLLKHLNLLVIAGGGLVYFMFVKNFKQDSEKSHINVP